MNETSPTKIIAKAIHPKPVAQASGANANVNSSYVVRAVPATSVTQPATFGDEVVAEFKEEDTEVVLVVVTTGGPTTIELTVLDNIVTPPCTIEVVTSVVYVVTETVVVV